MTYEVLTFETAAKLRLLAQFFDSKYTKDSGNEVQKDLLKWADEIEYIIGVLSHANTDKE